MWFQKAGIETIFPFTFLLRFQSFKNKNSNRSWNKNFNIETENVKNVLIFILFRCVQSYCPPDQHQSCILVFELVSTLKKNGKESKITLFSGTLNRKHTQRVFLTRCRRYLSCLRLSGISQDLHLRLTVPYWVV